MDRTPWAWLVLVGAATLLLSRTLACATPFAGLGALAAVTLGRRDGILLVSMAWVGNQAVGFGLLHYPLDAPTLAWGAAIGVASLAGWAGARAMTGFAGGWVAVALCLPAGFAAYEGVLLAATLLLPSAQGAVAPAVMAQLLLVNGAAFGLLLLARRLAAGVMPGVPAGSGMGLLPRG